MNGGAAREGLDINVVVTFVLGRNVVVVSTLTTFKTKTQSVVATRTDFDLRRQFQQRLCRDNPLM